MNTLWILILLIPITGFVKGLDVDTVASFKTEEACMAAAEQIREIYESKRDSKLMALCVPDTLE